MPLSLLYDYRLVSFLLELSILLEQGQLYKGEVIMFGLGKKRSKLGKYIDSKGIHQSDLVKASGVSKNAVTRACSGDEVRDISKKLLVSGVNQLTGEKKKVSDFW